MVRRGMLMAMATAIALLALPAAAQAPQAAPTAAPAAETRVRLTTSEGDIVLALDAARAPISAANYLAYVDQGKLDGAVFYRAMAMGPGVGLIQGGVQNDPARSLPPIAHEPTSQTGLTHSDGVISMARYAPGTATAEFFITIGDMRGLNAGPPPMDPDGFAAFGRVVEGMDVVRKILTAPTSPTEGEGVMKGQMLEPKITIVTARRDG